MHSKNNFFKMLLLVFVFGIVTNFDLDAQENHESSIKQTIDNYILGWRTGNKQLLQNAFDSNAGVVLWIDKKDGSEVLKSMKLSELVANDKIREGYGVDYTIENLEIIDERLAVAIVKIPNKKSHYIDCLQLQRLNDEWKIVLKSFVYFPSK